MLSSGWDIGRFEDGRGQSRVEEGSAALGGTAVEGSGFPEGSKGSSGERITVRKEYYIQWEWNCFIMVREELLITLKGKGREV